MGTVTTLKQPNPDFHARGEALANEITELCSYLYAAEYQLLLKIRAREIDRAARLLTRSDEMEALAAGVRKLPILEGWRYEVFGKDALELVEGRLAFAVKDGKLLMTHIDDMESELSDAQAAE